MYRIVYSGRFKKNLRKLTKSGKFDINKLHYVVNALAQGNKLPDKYKDHFLAGELKGFRECHIYPDLLLIYIKLENVMVLNMMRIGTHSDLF